ncbi:S10 family serine carboxypeptidase-like protein [Duganella flavida]|uniref:S10 family serine carboxypeptidase-like protein n=1 Tax=Duganella flavida TaxID=2692175 RepID=UPI003530FF69
MAFCTKLQWRRPALVGAILLAGCGGGGGGSSGTTTPTTPPVTTPAVPGSFADVTVYSSAATGSLSAPNENAAVIASHIQLNGKQFDYTATTGHLTAVDAKTGQASVSFFYVAYTVTGTTAAKRPVTFFYNGGPGSASTYLHLGSFGPRRLVSTIPSANIPPVQLVDNQETLLATSDLVFIDAVGTGYTQAVAPNTNADFWGVDKDAASFRDFVQRYIAVNKREASPKFLYGESYGAPRTGVLANLLETAGVQIDGLVLQSAIMDYNSNCGVLDPNAISCEGYIPTYALTSAYHGRATPVPVETVRNFATGGYRTAIAAYLASKVAPPSAVLNQLSDLTGMSTLIWQQNFDMQPGYYQQNAVPGQLLGRYDARVLAPTGSALTRDGDPSLTVVNASFSSSIVTYMANELHYSAGSAYAPFIDIVNRWNFSHDGKQLPDTIPDLTAALTLNPAMKILAINGYHDLATPFHQTELDLARLGENQSIVLKYYASGHMTYLDDTARRAQQTDLINFMNSVTVSH